MNLGPEYTCGYLTVPEDRMKPDGRMIRLAVARVKAVSASPPADPIVYLDGGPGGSALISAATVVKGGINAERDVIFVDQRGAFHSEPALTCPEIDTYLATVATLHFSDPATGELSNAATQACRDRLADAGIDLASYNTAENAADIADLRVAMGIDTWNLYGVSYGTDLALTVLRDHPAGIRSAVLDSVVPPNLNPIDRSWPAGAAGYQAIFDACAAQPACAAAYPNLADEFASTVTRLTETPLVVAAENPAGETVQVNIDGYQYANLMILYGLAGTDFESIPQVMHQVANGDGAQAAKVLLSYIPPPGLIGYGLQWGAFCREFVSQSTPESVLENAKAALPAFPDAVLAMVPQIPRTFDDCKIWNAGTAPPAQRAAVVSDVPVLMMAGTFDGVTPPSWIDSVKPGLANAQVVAIPGGGHQVIHVPCAQVMMTAFIAEPTEDVDRACVDQIELPTFTTP